MKPANLAQASIASTLGKNIIWIPTLENLPKS